MVKRKKQFYENDQHLDQITKVRIIDIQYDELSDLRKNSSQIDSNQQYIQISSQKLDPKQILINRCNFALQCLQQNNVPNVIICRNKELMQIQNFLINALFCQKKGCSHPLLITGCPGVGKTMSVLNCIKRIKNKYWNHRIKSIVINLMNLRQLEDIYSIIFKELFTCTKILKKQQILRYLFEYFKNEKIKGFRANQDDIIILVIDQIEYLTKSKKKIQEILYNLLQWLSYTTTKIAMIIISNALDIKQKLQENINSRIGNQIINFRAYNSTQMILIAQQRLDSLPIFSDLAINFLIKKIAITSTDIRKMLKIFRMSISIFLKSGINQRHLIGLQQVKESYNLIYCNPTVFFMSKLDKTTKFIILLIALQTKREQSKEVCCSNIYIKFKAIKNSVSFNNFINFLMNLKALNYVRLNQISNNHSFDLIINLNVELDEIINGLQEEQYQFSSIFNQILR